MFGWLDRFLQYLFLLPPIAENDDVWRRASLDFIRARLPIVGTTWPQQSEIDSAIPRIAKTREWVAAIEDPRMRHHCERWCDFAERQVERAQKELRKNRQVREIVEAAKSECGDHSRGR